MGLPLKVTICIVCACTSFIVRTEENEEDYVLDTEYLWNENDTVAVNIAKDKIKLSLKAEVKK